MIDLNKWRAMNALAQQIFELHVGDEKLERPLCARCERHIIRSKPLVIIVLEQADRHGLSDQMPWVCSVKCQEIHMTNLMEVEAAAVAAREADLALAADKRRAAKAAADQTEREDQAWLSGLIRRHDATPEQANTEAA